MCFQIDALLELLNNNGDDDDDDDDDDDNDDDQMIRYVDIVMLLVAGIVWSHCWHMVVADVTHDLVAGLLGAAVDVRWHGAVSC